MRTQEAATGTTDFSNILAQLRPGDQEATTTESSVTTTQAKHGFPDACLVIPLKLCLVAGHCGKKIKNRKRRGRGREGGKKKEEGKKKFNNSMTLLASSRSSQKCYLHFSSLTQVAPDSQNLNPIRFSSCKEVWVM